MSMQSKLRKVGERLADIDIENVSHYWRDGLDAPFLVWTETGENSSVSGDNGKIEQAIAGSVDYYTSEEFDPICDDIQEALDEIGAWRLLSVQYEEDTNLIHFEWEFEVI